jgi:O-antigen/teichoic acid export membrane protein
MMTGEEIAGLLFGPEYLSSGIALYFIAPFLVLNVLIQINFQILG